MDRPCNFHITDDVIRSLHYADLLMAVGFIPALFILCHRRWICFVPLHSWQSRYDLNIMGGFRAVEDRPTPKEVYNWRLYFEAAVIATGSLLWVTLPGVLLHELLWYFSDSALAMTAHLSAQQSLAQVLKKTSIFCQPRRVASRVISRLHSRRVLSLEPSFASLVGLGNTHVRC